MKRLVLAFLLAQLGAMGLSLWANLGVALGLHPESALQLDWFAPGAALFLAAWWSARHRTWRPGAATAMLCVAFYLAAQLYLATRFAPEFWRDGWSQLGAAHLVWWIGALLLGALGGVFGTRFPAKRVGMALSVLALVGMWGVQWLWCLAAELDAMNYDYGNNPTLGKNGGAGEAELVEPQADGTTIHLLRFDLRRVRLGIYDADSDDSHPYDNRNATWLDQPLRRVWRNIAARDGRAPLCIVNGGFFGNAESWIGTHEAPLLSDGKARYNTNVLQTDWPQQAATLVWKREAGVVKPRIRREISFKELENCDGALGGVRVLREGGRDATLAPGMGGATLRCSRTSVAFDSQNLWVLSVRDPDGEASSVRANKWEKAHPGAPKIQVGGWDVAQVQRFWRERKIPNAVLFDGGESSQLGADYGDGPRVVHSSFHFSRTLGFWNGKPLRLVLPLLPPDEANGGVLNWFYVSAN